jgi:fatty acid/phospholipid biosynthesis enzyme
MIITAKPKATLATPMRATVAENDCPSVCRILPEINAATFIALQFGAEFCKSASEMGGFTVLKHTIFYAEPRTPNPGLDLFFFNVTLLLSNKQWVCFG